MVRAASNASERGRRAFIQNLRRGMVVVDTSSTFHPHSQGSQDTPADRRRSLPPNHSVNANAARGRTIVQRDTAILHAGYRGPELEGPSLGGPQFSSTYTARGDPAGHSLTYGRFQNPTWTAWETALGEQSAWDVFVWYGGLVQLAGALAETGLTGRFAESAAALTHGWPWAAAVLGLAIEGIFRFEIGPASISTISVDDWGAKVLGVNEMVPA